MIYKKLCQIICAEFLKKPPTTSQGIDPTIIFLQNILRSNFYPRCWRIGCSEQALRRAQEVHQPVDGDRADSEGMEDAAEPHPLTEGAWLCAGHWLQPVPATGVQHLEEVGTLATTTRKSLNQKLLDFSPPE